MSIIWDHFLITGPELALHDLEKINSILVDNYGNKKPSHSYADLIRMAITSTDSKRMTLSEIYDFVGKYPTTHRTTLNTTL